MKVTIDIPNPPSGQQVIDVPIHFCGGQVVDAGGYGFEERKKGKWVDINGNVLPINKFGSPKGNAWCSVCNHLLFGSDSKQIPDGNYCPYCGVKMEVDDG